MPSATIKSIAGLYTSPNPYSKVPEGALTIADDVVISGLGVLGPRRGMPNSAQNFAADRCFPLPNTRNAIVTARGSSTPSVYNPDSDTVTALSRSGGVQPFGYPYQGDARTSVWGAQADSNLYLNGQQGTVAVAGNAAPGWRATGLPRPAVPVFFQLNTGAGATLVVNKRRTYMLTLAWYDPLGNFYESEPSEQFYIENTASYGGGGGTATVIPQFTLWYPPMTPIGAFFRVWRAVETASGTTGSAEVFLIREVIDASQAAGADGYVSGTGRVTFTDYSIDSLLNDPLYTNPQTGNGLDQQNTRPPAAAAIAWFKQRQYFGRTTFQQQIELQIIGTGTGGVQVGDQVTIAGQVFIGAAPGSTSVGNPPAPTIPLFDVQASLDVASNIEQTARSLVGAINFYFSTVGPGVPPSRRVYAYYASSGVNDFGRIVIMRPVPSPLTDDPGIAFSVVTTSAGIRFPSGSITSTDNYTPGGLSWSIYNEPEAVPGINFVAVGDPQKAILGFAVLRDSMIIFKEQEGAYILYDTGGPQPSIQLLDPTVDCISPQTISVCNNVAYCLTAKGPARVTEQSTDLVFAEGVRTDIQRLTFQNVNLEATAFGASYDSERLWILGLPVGPSENSCSQQYAFNWHNGSWTRWTKAGATSALMLPVQKKLMMTYAAPLPGGNVVTGLQPAGVYLERRGGICSMDYADLIGALPAATYAALTVASSAPGPASVVARSTLTYAQDMHLQVFEGDLLLFAYTDGNDGKKRTQYARVVSVSKAVVSLDAAGVISTDGTNLMVRAPTYYRAVPSHWRFSQAALGEPTYEKQWNQTQHAFRYFDGDWLDVLLDTEKSGPRTFTQAPADPKIGNTAGTTGTTTWLRNVKDVIVRVDPAMAEARGARIGMEFVFAQALARFELVAGSAQAGEWKDKATR